MGQCAATAKTGKPCKISASSGQTFCHVHKKQKTRQKVAIGTVFVVFITVLGIISDVTGILGFAGFEPFSSSAGTTESYSPPETKSSIEDPMWSTESFNSITESYDMHDVFPFFIGTTWTYTYSRFLDVTTQEDDITQSIGTFSEKVITIESGLSDEIKIVGVEVSSDSPLDEKSEETPFSGNLDKWYVFNNSLFFEVYSKSDAYAIAQGLREQDDTLISTPDYIAPFEVGDLWTVFPNDPPREDTHYQWFVEAKVDVKVPLGEIKDCYRILLYTLPDTTIRWVCPGYGLVATEYHHTGAVVDYRAELSNLSIKEIQLK